MNETWDVTETGPHLAWGWRTENPGERKVLPRKVMHGNSHLVNLREPHEGALETKVRSLCQM